jgi:hypothetical protein
MSDQGPRVPDAVRHSFRLAKSLRQPWEAKWQELLGLAMPYRTGFHGADAPNTPVGSIYDETGLISVQEFANRLQQGIMPGGVQWASFQGDQLDDQARAGLAAVQRYVFDLLAVSNLDMEGNDFFLDVASFGNACLRQVRGPWEQPLLFQAIPLANAWVTPGPNGRWADIHVRYLVPPYALRAQYPDADIPAKLMEQGPERPLEIIDSWIRDLDSPTERWLNVLHHDGKCMLRRRELSGSGSCEYIFARWSKGAGELYGTGQGMLAMPAMRVANEIARYSFANAEIALSGVWQAEDDGVLNPSTVQLVPGAIIPIAPGSKGLQPLSTHTGGRFDLSQLELKEARHSIKRALYCEQLGPREGTPATALEIEERMAELNRSIGSPIARVWHEAAVPLLARTRRVLDDAGLAVMPVIDGRKVKVRPMASMVRAATLQNVRKIGEWAGMIGGLYGPQALASVVSAERMARHTGADYDIPADLMFSPEEMKANAAQMGQMVGQAQADGSLADLAPLMAGMMGAG